MSSVEFSLKNLIISLLGLIIVFAVIVFIIPGSMFDAYISPRLALLMSFSIGLFAVVEALSTYRQWADSTLNRKSDLIREQLEKVYGPLFSNLTFVEEQTAISGRQIGEDEYELEYLVWYDSDVNKLVNDIFLNYPYMIEEDLYNLWQKDIRNSSWKTREHVDFPRDFVENCINAYRMKIEEYNNLRKT